MRGKGILVVLNQNLSLLTKELVNIYFNRRLDPSFWSPSVWAGEFGRGPEEATDKRPFAVNPTPFFAQMNAIQIGDGLCLFCFAFAWQSRHFLGGGRNRAAAVMATGDTVKSRDTLSKETDFLLAGGH